MYTEHFGLTRPAFRITPDTSLFYSGGKRGSVLDALVYAVTAGEGIIKVVGEVGSGKTMLCRMLETRLPENVEIVYIANPSLSADHILQVIAYELNIDIGKGEKFEAMQKLQAWLLKQHTAGKHVVVFIEEAQGMPLETLEEIRLLSNLETEDSKLLQMVLFGQPELDENLDQTNIRQLRERIGHSFYLAPLSVPEIHEYLNFRMRQAGYKGPDIFSENVSKAVEKYSLGLIRRINILADKALLAAFAAGTNTVKCQHIELAAKDSRYKVERQNWFSYSLAASLILGVAGGVGSFHFLNQSYANKSVHGAGKFAMESATDFAVVEDAAVSLVSLSNTADLPQALTEQIETQQPVSVGKLKPLAVSGDALKDDGYSLQFWKHAAKQWVAAAPGKNFSIQLLTVNYADGERLANDLLKLSADIELDKIYVYETRINSQTMLGVLYNDYPSRKSALSAMDLLPPFLQNNRPFLRTVSRLREEIAG